jgi:hypothetical protein
VKWRIGERLEAGGSISEQIALPFALPSLNTADPDLCCPLQQARPTYPVPWQRRSVKPLPAASRNHAQVCLATGLTAIVSCWLVPRPVVRRVDRSGPAIGGGLRCRAWGRSGTGATRRCGGRGKAVGDLAAGQAAAGEDDDLALLRCEVGEGAGVWSAGVAVFGVPCLADSGKGCGALRVARIRSCHAASRTSTVSTLRAARPSGQRQLPTSL